MEIILFIYSYLFLGLLYAFYFVFFKVRRIDKSAMHTSLFFKMLIFCGCVLLWPILITKKQILHT